MDGAKCKELELCLKKNNLPRVNIMLSNIFKVLGREEKDDLTAHKLEDLTNKLAKHEDKYGEQIRNITNFLENLGIEEIATPVRGISEFIEDDLRTTEPAFLGSMVTALRDMDNEHRKVTNTPLTAKLAWAKVFAVLFLVGFIVTLGYLGYVEGWFDDIQNQIGGGFGGLSGFSPSGGLSEQELMQLYPNPDDLKAAVDSGKVDYDTLPPNVKALVDGIE